MTGTGPTGYFDNRNAANTSDVISANTNGIGRIINMTNANAANASNLLTITSNGTGRGMLVTLSNNVNASSAMNHLQRILTMPPQVPAPIRTTFTIMPDYPDTTVQQHINLELEITGLLTAMEYGECPIA